MGNYNRYWTDVRIKRLYMLVKDGKTYQECATDMRVTRMAIAGAISRYIQIDSQEIKIVKIQKPEKEKKNYPHGRLSINFPKKFAPMRKEIKISHVPIPWPPAYGFCQNIIGDNLRNPVCCGLQVTQDRVYCPIHCRANYVPNTPRK